MADWGAALKLPDSLILMNLTNEKVYSTQKTLQQDVSTVCLVRIKDRKLIYLQKEGIWERIRKKILTLKLNFDS